jgi:hypothetical protein
MNKIELEHIEAFLNGSKQEKQALFLEYLDKFNVDIKWAKTHFKKYLKSTEVDSDAIFAIQDMFLEARASITRVEDKKERYISALNLKSIFHKHLQRQARNNKLENQPLTKAIKVEFKKSTKKRVYKGYEYTAPVTRAHNSVMDETYIVDPDVDESDHMKRVMDIIKKDKGSTMYKDLIEYVVERRTLISIANSPRNKGITKQAVYSRIKRYIVRLKKKLNLEDK